MVAGGVGVYLSFAEMEKPSGPGVIPALGFVAVGVGICRTGC